MPFTQKERDLNIKQNSDLFLHMLSKFEIIWIKIGLVKDMNFSETPHASWNFFWI